jgi:spermidine/putrescine-binding protein
MDQEILKKACARLNWTFRTVPEQNQQVLYVYDVNQKSKLYGEFALKVVDNIVTYNSYYLKNGRELIKALEDQFYQLNVAYAEQTIVNKFKPMGFKQVPDDQFVPTSTEVMRFRMVAYSEMLGETDESVEIEFTIKNDGTIVSDSNYIPADIHLLADKAMEGIDKAFGTIRLEGEHIKRKPIPAKYRDKAYCKASQLQQH